jgi:hypothetical protein
MAIQDIAATKRYNALQNYSQVNCAVMPRKYGVGDSGRIRNFRDLRALISSAESSHHANNPYHLNIMPTKKTHSENPGRKEMALPTPLTVITIRFVQ